MKSQQLLRSLGTIGDDLILEAGEKLALLEEVNSVLFAD